MTNTTTMSVVSVVGECVACNYVLSAVVAFAIYKLLTRETRNVPPGPWGVPFLGYMPFFGKFSHKDCVQLAEKYGSVFSVKLGPNNAVM